jgi:hypothetical protein
MAATLHDLEPVWLECHPRNPCRPLDWRWRVAQVLARSGRPRRFSWIDPPVRRAVRYLRRTASRSTAAGARRARPDALMVEAVRLWHAPERSRRQEIEARLLAGQDEDTIAQRMGLAAETIQVGAALFFDVRSQLESRDHLRFAVLGDALSVPGRPITRDIILPLLCLDGGPAVADALLDPTRQAELASDLDLLQTALALPVAARTALRIFKLADRLAELLRLQDARAQPAWTTSATLAARLQPADLAALGGRFGEHLRPPAPCPTTSAAAATASAAIDPDAIVASVRAG